MKRSACKPTHEQIAVCAYLIWEEEGRPEGRAAAHWQEAEKQLMAAYSHKLGIQSNTPQMKQFVGGFDEPLLVVDWDVRAETANKGFLKLVHKQLDQIEGRLGGELIECRESFGIKGCGHAALCSECGTRKAVTHTYQTGQSLQNVVSHHTVLKPSGDIARIRMHVSTEKIDQSVIMSIDRVEDLGVISQ